MYMLYGIKNCDTVADARRWLDSHGIRYAFHDFRANGLDKDSLVKFEAVVGWQILLNRRGTSWRKLSLSERENVDREKSLDLMLSNPTLIKRPVLEADSKILVGFTPDYYALEL